MLRRISSLLALGLVAAAVSVPAAHADTTTTLTSTKFAQLLVDQANGHVYVTGGNGTNGVEVRNLSGAYVTTVANQPGATGIVLSPDGSTLYVALSNGDSVSAIDTTTLTESARWSTGASSCPSWLAWAHAELWVGYGCDGGSGRLAALDPTATTPALATASDTTFYYAPRVVSDRAERLLGMEHSLSPGTIHSFDLSSGAAVSVASVDPGSNCQDLALTPDGADVVVACGAPYQHPVYKVSDLSANGVYPSSTYPNAVAVSPGGLVAAGTNSSYDVDVRVYRPGASAPMRTYEFGSDALLATAGLAFSPDGTRLYAVTGPYGGPYSLRVLDNPTAATSTLTLSAPASATRGATVALSGALTSAEPVTAPVQLTVTKIDLAGTHSLPSVTTAADGTFSFNDTPAIGGTNTYRVSFAGDAVHQASISAGGAVAVSRSAAVVTLVTNKSTYAYGERATVTAHLGTTYNGRVVTLYATPYGGTRATLLTGSVNSSGNLTAYYTMRKRTAFTVSFPGDYRYAPASASATRYAKALIKTTLTGYYGTSGSYRLYRSTRPSEQNAKLSPAYGGVCLWFRAQSYYSGAWHAAAGPTCLRTDSTGFVAAVYGGTHVIGRPYRLRAEWRTTTANSAYVSPWQYVKFTR